MASTAALYLGPGFTIHLSGSGMVKDETSPTSDVIYKIPLITSEDAIIKCLFSGQFLDSIFSYEGIF